MNGATMQHRTFGRLTGLRVSEYALGAGNFGTSCGTGATPDEARRMFERFAGGRDADRHRRELQLGESGTILADLSAADRDHFVLATKYSNGVGNPGVSTSGKRPQEHEPRGRGQPQTAEDRPDRSLLGSLRGRRGVDRGDPPRARRSRLQRQDRPRGTVELPGLACRAGADDRGAARLVADLGIQVEYSLVERTADREPLPMAEALVLGVTLWSPLRGGLLTGKYRLSDEGHLS
jgi:aryl-alcohol dehydrogenase-like predicted oxidoreductase